MGEAACSLWETASAHTLMARAAGGGGCRDVPSGGWAGDGRAVRLDDVHHADARDLPAGDLGADSLCHRPGGGSPSVYGKRAVRRGTASVRGLRKEALIELPYRGVYDKIK